MKSILTNLSEEQIGKMILDSAFMVHTKLGPGLLESVYESALAWELTKLGLFVERQKTVPVEYDGQQLDVAFRADLIVNSLVLIELKSVEVVSPLFKKVVTNYLRLANIRLGFLINFNEAHLKNGLTRITNGLEGKIHFNKRPDPNAGLKAFSPCPSSPPSRPSRETSP